MSKADNTIMGLEHGKIGDRIAVVLNGQQIYKKLYKPTNPRKPAQQKHRGKIGFINKLSAKLADAINLGYALVPKPKSGRKPRNEFVHDNFYNGATVWDEEKGEWGVCYEHLWVARGPRFIDRGMTATVDGGMLHITCPNPGMRDSHAVADDQLMVALYRPAVPMLHLFDGPLREECGESFYDLPESEGEEDVMHVYAWFQATKYHRPSEGKITVRPGQASNSIYLGAFSK